MHFQVQTGVMKDSLEENNPLPEGPSKEEHIAQLETQVSEILMKSNLTKENYDLEESSEGGKLEIWREEDLSPVRMRVERRGDIGKQELMYFWQEGRVIAISEWKTAFIWDEKMGEQVLDHQHQIFQQRFISEGKILSGDLEEGERLLQE